MRKNSTPQIQPSLDALENQEAEAAHLTHLRDRYNGAASTLKHHRDSDKIKQQRDARQGDNILNQTLYSMSAGCLQQQNQLGGQRNQHRR